jgi:D-galactarolactone cycloisomerase
MRITAIETRSYRYPLDPPFRAAWDPKPRTHQDATVVLVHTDDGVTGVASGGDGLSDTEVAERHLVGVDLLRTEVVREVLETVDFHGGRPWAIEVAVWDAIGKALGEPLWKLLGGRSEQLRAYASTGERIGADERAERCLELVERGIGAVKLRFHDPDWRADVKLVAHVRGAVGDRLEIMVDANQGWRMPGDRAERWDVGTAIACARELEQLGVYWLEEPLRTDDAGGYRTLREATGVKLAIAAGEMVRASGELRDLVVHGGIDVLQADVLFAGGIGGCRRLAALAELHGRAWSPHTWSNGPGLIANLHAALAFSTVPWVEVPFDPPAWGPERRDWLLAAPLEIADDGTIGPPSGPGLGIGLDFDRLEEWRVG